jgi:hypothetical protein
MQSRLRKIPLVRVTSTYLRSLQSAVGKNEKPETSTFIYWLTDALATANVTGSNDKYILNN